MGVQDGMGSSASVQGQAEAEHRHGTLIPASGTRWGQCRGPGPDLCTWDQVEAICGPRAPGFDPGMKGQMEAAGVCGNQSQCMGGQPKSYRS